MAEILPRSLAMRGMTASAHRCVWTGRESADRLGGQACCATTRLEARCRRQSAGDTEAGRAAGTACRAPTTETARTGWAERRKAASGGLTPVQGSARDSKKGAASRRTPKTAGNIVKKTQKLRESRGRSQLPELGHSRLTLSVSDWASGRRLTGAFWGKPWAAFIAGGRLRIHHD